jgi:small subunit ribosomal protein S19e
MVSIYDVEPRALIEALAKELEKMPEMAPPAWAAFVKTGRHNMRPPQNDNWWYIRSGSILRAVYKLGPIGVSKLRTKYGGRKNRGHKPDRTYKAGGNIIRKILQKLELVGLVKQAQVGVHKGRIITPKGESFVDKIAVSIKDKYTIKKSKPKQEKKEEPKEVKKENKTEAKKENKSEEKKTEKKTEKKEKPKQEEKKPKEEKKEKKPKKKKTEKKEAKK